MNIRSINLLLFEVISSIGSKVFSFACAFYILRNTETASIYSIYLAIIVLCSILSAPIFGIWADKYNNKKIVLIAQIINIIALALFVPLFQHFFMYILLLGIILNLTDGAISLIVSSNIKNIAQKDMERFVSLRQMYNIGISILSPIIGGFLIAFVSISSLALLNIITEAVSIVLMFYLTMDRVIQTGDNSFLQDFKEGFSYFFKHKMLLKIIMIATILNFLVNSIVVGVPIISIQTFKLSPQQFGLVESAFTIGMFIISLIATFLPLKQKFKGPFQCSIILQFLALFTLGLALALDVKGLTGFVVVFVVYLIIGVSLPVMNIPYSIYLQTNIEEHIKGRVLSLNQSMAMALTPLSLLIFGVLMNYSQAGVYLSVSFLILIVFIYFSITIKKENPTHA